MCAARVRLVEDKRLSVWQVPENITGRYIRVQLEGFNFLHFSQVEVFGVFGINKSVGRVNYAIAGKNVTAAVIRPSSDPRDTEIAYKRAIAADSYNSDILRQFETYALEYGKFGRGDAKNKMATCLLCKGGQMCETCTMKFEHRDELAKLPLGPGGRLRRLDSISNFLLATEKPPLNYKPKPKKKKAGIIDFGADVLKSLNPFGKKKAKTQEEKDDEEADAQEAKEAEEKKEEGKEADANAESKDDGDAGEEDDDDDDDSDGSDNDSDEGSDDDEGGSEEEESDEDEAKG